MAIVVLVMRGLIKRIWPEPYRSREQDCSVAINLYPKSKEAADCEAEFGEKVRAEWRKRHLEGQEKARRMREEQQKTLGRVPSR